MTEYGGEWVVFVVVDTQVVVWANGHGHLVVANMGLWDDRTNIRIGWKMI